MSDVDVFSKWYFDDHPSQSVVEIFIDVPWWLDGVHEGDGLILKDSCPVVDSVVHMGDEVVGEVIDGRHQSSYWIMEELVVGEFFVGSVLKEIGVGDVFDREVGEAECCSCHPKRDKDMVVAVFMEGLS